MSRIAEVARLKEREQKLRVISDMGEYDTAGLEKRFQHQLRNAAPWLLAVAGQFRAGDIKILDDLIDHLDANRSVGESPEYEMAEICCLRRMLEAAKEMGGEQG